MNKVSRIDKIKEKAEKVRKKTLELKKLENIKELLSKKDKAVLYFLKQVGWEEQVEDKESKLYLEKEDLDILEEVVQRKIDRLVDEIKEIFNEFT